MVYELVVLCVPFLLSALGTALLSVAFRFHRLLRSTFAIAAIVILSFIPLIILIAMDVPNPGAVSVIYAASMATIGWIVSLLESQANQRHTHTLQFLQSTFRDPLLEAHRLNISKTYPYGVPVSEADVEGLFAEYSDPAQYRDGAYPPLYSIVYLLNNYELIATQVRARQLDEKVVRWYGDLLVAGCRKFTPVIHELQRRAGRDAGGVYPDLLWLYRRWQKQAFPARPGAPVAAAAEPPSDTEAVTAAQGTGSPDDIAPMTPGVIAPDLVPAPAEDDASRPTHGRV